MSSSFGNNAMPSGTFGGGIYIQSVLKKGTPTTVPSGWADAADPWIAYWDISLFVGRAGYFGFDVQNIDGTYEERNWISYSETPYSFFSKIGDYVMWNPVIEDGVVTSCSIRIRNYNLTPTVMLGFNHEAETQLE